ncbi:MAG TPA: DnaJ domain-containing protein [Xanthobacteraceae bacterium]|jgi:DnaJ-like protein|nr:DnaJ domain-containing protein [Xanthobacteraceae bacterium]
MATILFGLVVLALVLWALNAFTKVNPQTAAVVLKTGGGLGALAVAGVLGVRGRLDIAIPLGLTGLGLLGWLPWSMPGFAARTQKRAGQMSRVRSAFVEMELDHDTGAMRGRVLAGRHEGAMLDALDVATLTGFLSEIDEESRALLMAYLDRREPRWREHAQADAATSTHGRVWSGGGKMTEDEAYQILGLQPGASAEDIGRAHRALMKKLHPDQGGSTYLAARVNEAKEVLLRRHR